MSGNPKRVWVCSARTCVRWMRLGKTVGQPQDPQVCRVPSWWYMAGEPSPRASGDRKQAWVWGGCRYGGDCHAWKVAAESRGGTLTHSCAAFLLCGSSSGCCHRSTFLIVYPFLGFHPLLFHPSSHSVAPSVTNCKSTQSCSSVVRGASLSTSMAAVNSTKKKVNEPKRR